MTLQLKHSWAKPATQKGSRKNLVCSQRKAELQRTARVTLYIFIQVLLSEKYYVYLWVIENKAVIITCVAEGFEENYRKLFYFLEHWKTFYSIRESGITTFEASKL